MISMERELLQTITTPFPRQKPENSVFGHFWPFFTVCACSWATPWSHLRFYWHNYYHWVLLQWYLYRESYSKLLPPHFPAISLKIEFLVIFGHFSPFVPTHVRPLDPASTFIDKNVFTRCCCEDKYGEGATPVYYAPFSSHFPENWIFGPFSAIFTICACL